MRPHLGLSNRSISCIRALTNTAERNEFAPIWSPDGERLVLTTSATEAGAPRLADRASLAEARVVVLDRGGHVLLDTRGFMPDWMPPWR